MKKLLTLMMVGSFLFAFTPLMAEETKAEPAQTEPAKSEAATTTKVKFVSTGEAEKHKSDTPAVGDPYSGKTLKARDLEGAPGTQHSYENCETEACKRAEQRQTQGTTWKEDVNSGLKPGGY